MCIAWTVEYMDADTSRSPFHHMQAVAAILGVAELPWEGEGAEVLCRKLGALRAPVLAMLHRSPSLRPSMASFHATVMELS